MARAHQDKKLESLNLEDLPKWLEPMLASGRQVQVASLAALSTKNTSLKIKSEVHENLKAAGEVVPFRIVNEKGKS